MPNPELSQAIAPFKVGDRVKIKNYAGKIGRIVELRGPLGPGGVSIYRVLVERKPAVSYIELREDQLELATASDQVV
jgi:hypothetical protein